MGQIEVASENHQLAEGAEEFALFLREFREGDAKVTAMGSATREDAGSDAEIGTAGVLDSGEERCVAHVGFIGDLDVETAWKAMRGFIG